MPTKRLTVCRWWPPDHPHSAGAVPHRLPLAGVETGLWANLPGEQRRYKRCNDGGVDDAEHMIWGYLALTDQRFQHVELFRGDATVETFM